MHPHFIISYFCKCIASILLATCFSSVSEMLLLLSADVKLNPGPTTASENLQPQFVLVSVQRIEQGQTLMLSDIKAIKEEPLVTESLVDMLLAKVINLEELQLLRNLTVSTHTPNDMHEHEHACRLGKCEVGNNRPIIF